MGREIASAFARWCALTDINVTPVLTAVADLNPTALEWFEKIPSLRRLAAAAPRRKGIPQPPKGA